MTTELTQPLHMNMHFRLHSGYMKECTKISVQQMQTCRMADYIYSATALPSLISS